MFLSVVALSEILELILTSGLGVQFVFMAFLQLGHVHEAVVEITSDAYPGVRHKLTNIIIFGENKCIFSKDTLSKIYISST